MSLLQELYTIYDRESARRTARRSSRDRLLQEMGRNLAFLRAGLKEGLSPEHLIDGLEDDAFRAALESGFHLDSIQRRHLSSATYSGVPAFDRYRGWSSGQLICKVYQRLAILHKLKSGADGINLTLRLQNLFKLMMVVSAHLEGRKLNMGDARKGDK